MKTGRVVVNSAYVTQRLDEVAQDEDLSKSIPGGAHQPSGRRSLGGLRGPNMFAGAEQLLPPHHSITCRVVPSRTNPKRSRPPLRDEESVHPTQPNRQAHTLPSVRTNVRAAGRGGQRSVCGCRRFLRWGASRQSNPPWDGPLWTTLRPLLIRRLSQRDWIVTVLGPPWVCTSTVTPFSSEALSMAFT